MTIEELKEQLRLGKMALQEDTNLSSRPAYQPYQQDNAKISSRHPYEVTMPYNQVGPFPINMNAGSPRGEVSYDPRSYAKEAALNFPGMAGTFAGKKALGYAAAPNKFSHLADKMERFEIDDSAIKLKIQNSSISGGFNLEDVIDHKELFKQYPYLKDIYVRIDDAMDVGQAAFQPWGNTPGRGTILISRNTKPEELKNNLVHEIQHAIQEYEGFAKGGNIGLVSMEEHERIKNMAGGDKEILATLSQQLRKRKQDTYTNLAGEIEARDAAFRRLYTPYERMTTQPGASQNIALEDYIVRK